MIEAVIAGQIEAFRRDDGPGGLHPFRAHLALYTMERQPGESWLIAAVALVTLPETGA